MTRFQEQFRRARKCSAPLISARSVDPVSTLQSIVGSLNGKSENVPLLQWDVVRGISGINPCGKNALAALLDGQDAAQVSARPTDCLGLLAAACPQDAIVCMHNLHLFWNDVPTLQAILNLRDRFKGLGSMLVGLNLTGAVLPAELTEHTLTLDEPLPTSAELAELTRGLFKDAAFADYTDETVSQTVDATQGLSLFAAEQSVSLNLEMSEQGCKGFDVSGVWERKRKMIESDGLLKVYAGPENFANYGGNEGFKSYVRAVFTGNDKPRMAVLWDEVEKAVAQDSGNSTKTELIGILLSWFQDRDIDGILSNGVPGAGKTNGVKCLGNEFGVPVVLMNVSAMQDKFVGNSQKRLLTALDRIDAMANGKVCVFGTCNRLEALSPEFRSRFRLGTFFFDLPNRAEQDAIWKIYLSQYFAGKTEFDLPPCEGWTGREIRECVYKAYRLNISLADSARYIVPVARANAEQIKTLRQQASGKFLSATESGLYRFEETASAPTGRKFRE